MQMTVRIGFRVDANEHVATGHLMRCMTIANECKAMGMECRFYLAEDKMTEKLRENAFPYTVLGTSWEQLHSEIHQMQEQVRKDDLHWLIVDTYQADAKYLEELNDVCNVMYIDDFAETVYSIAAILHYSYLKNDTETEQLYQGKNTSVLAGADYIPIRKEFWDVDKKQRSQAVLVTTGGTDPLGITQIILKMKNRYPILKDYTFHVLVGKMNQFTDELESLEHMDDSIILHKNINNVGDYMRLCQCAISAGGTTLYELCACQTPTICFSFADNQREFVDCMGKEGIMLSVGDARDDGWSGTRIMNALVKMIEQPELRNTYIEKMKGLVDRKGTIRIAEFLMESISNSKFSIDNHFSNIV